MPVFAGVDVGASGGRVVAGDGSSSAIDVVHRFPNGVVERDGHLRWDVRRLVDEVKVGLAKVPEAASIGIDTWGVDYGLLDDAGELLADPVAYRDGRTQGVRCPVPADELYAITGTQHLPFNTVFQLLAEPLLDRAAHALLIPDLLTFLLTGAKGTELTNASTTGLLDARTQRWSSDLFSRLGLPNPFPPIDGPGVARGEYEGVPVVTVGSHDTASAVAGVPFTSDRAAYISCGTWSLVGVLLDAPVLTPAARVANFTNEVAVDGRIRFLRNVGGLWLLQECLRSWGRTDLDTLLAGAATRPAGPTIDVDDPTFIAPDGMPSRIHAAVGRVLDHDATVRCILDSLADAFARTITAAQELSGVEVDVVHLVGGGSQSSLLHRLVSDAAGRPVVAGPAEATAFGNVLVQARAYGNLAGR